jgi:hypothetical protein
MLKSSNRRSQGKLSLASDVIADSVIPIRVKISDISILVNLNEKRQDRRIRED